MVNFLVGISADILDYFVKIRWLTGMFPLWLGNILWLAKVRNSLRNCHQYKQQPAKWLLFLYFPRLSVSSDVVNLKVVFWEDFTNVLV